MTTLTEVDRTITQELLRAAQAAREEGAKTTRRQFLEGISNRALQLTPNIEADLAGAWAALESPAGCDGSLCHEWGKKEQELLNEYLELLVELQRDCEAVMDAGFKLAVGARLTSTIETIKKAQKRLEQDWPWLDQVHPADHGRIAESLEQVRRGEFQEMGDFIREMEGPHPARG